MKCSLIINTYNNEDKIGRCLDSAIATGAFDEIVIGIDTRTDDNTLQEIMKRKDQIRLNVFYVKWDITDYSKGRNAILSRAKNLYIFMLDSDEIISDKGDLLELLDKPEICAYKVNIKNRLESGDYLLTQTTRLFPKLSNSMYELPIHEQVDFALRKRSVPILPSNIAIEHDGYSDRAINLEKHKRYYPIFLDFFKDKDKWSLGQISYMSERFNDTTTALRNSGVLGELGIAPVIIEAIITLVLTAVKMGLNYKLALETAKAQAELQQALTDAEVDKLAYALAPSFPTIPQYELRQSVKLIMQTNVSPLPKTEQTPETATEGLNPMLLGLGLIAIILLGSNKK